MANLPQTGISISLVKQTLGAATNDLGLLIAKARTGGKETLLADGSKQLLAFEMDKSENKDGILIDNAVPFWNIWSASSPGFFDPYYASGKMVFRLNRGSAGTVFALGDFRNYNHQAETPGVRVTNYKDDVVFYYDSTQSINLVYSVVCGELNWNGDTDMYNRFYLKITGITPTGGESEVAWVESPAYVTVDGSTRGYNGQYALTYFKAYCSLRIELWLAYKTASGDIINAGKVPYINSQVLNLVKKTQGITLVDVLWFYKYSTDQQVLIPGYSRKIPTVNSQIEFIGLGGDTGEYVIKFTARIDGSEYVDIPSFGNVSIAGTYEVLIRGRIINPDGSVHDCDYEPIGEILLTFSNNTYELQVPAAYAGNKFDAGYLSLFIRKV